MHVGSAPVTRCTGRDMASRTAPGQGSTPTYIHGVRRAPVPGCSSRPAPALTSVSPSHALTRANLSEPFPGFSFYFLTKTREIRPPMARPCRGRWRAIQLAIGNSSLLLLLPAAALAYTAQMARPPAWPRGRPALCRLAATSALTLPYADLRKLVVCRVCGAWRVARSKMQSSASRSVCMLARYQPARANAVAHTMPRASGTRAAPGICTAAGATSAKLCLRGTAEGPTQSLRSPHRASRVRAFPLSTVHATRRASRSSPP